ncbi:MAG TPA: hypothetical protein VIF13_05505, partial [Hyphomicrobium sp.]
AALYAEGVAEGRRGIWLKAPPGQLPASWPTAVKPRAPAKKSPVAEQAPGAAATTKVQPGPLKAKASPPVAAASG